jgi:hypothetical protein
VHFGPPLNTDAGNLLALIFRRGNAARDLARRRRHVPKDILQSTKGKIHMGSNLCWSVGLVQKVQRSL